MLVKWSDAHAHIEKTSDKLTRVLAEGSRVIMMSTSYSEDWHLVQESYQLNPRTIIPCFGTHPWFVSKNIHTNEQMEQYLNHLKEWLKRYPDDTLVGEIGLDKSMRISRSSGDRRKLTDPEWQMQIDIFTDQFKLAALFSRPVSLHCVNAYGQMLQIFKNSEQLPPAIMMHSYSGSKETVRELLALETSKSTAFYFSFSRLVCERLKNLELIIENIPDNRILIESDMEINFATGEHDSDYDNNMSWISDKIAQVKQWTTEVALDILTINLDNYVTSKDINR